MAGNIPASLRAATNVCGLVASEQEGIDYAATTVQLPGGERVPFLFTVKEVSPLTTFLFNFFARRRSKSVHVSSAVADCVRLCCSVCHTRSNFWGLQSTLGPHTQEFMNFERMRVSS